MPDTEPDSYLSAKQTRHRFGDVSDMTLWRWIKDPALGFPPPFASTAAASGRLPT